MLAEAAWPYKSSHFRLFCLHSRACPSCPMHLKPDWSFSCVQRGKTVLWGACNRMSSTSSTFSLEQHICHAMSLLTSPICSLHSSLSSPCVRGAEVRVDDPTINPSTAQPMSCPAQFLAISCGSDGIHERGRVARRFDTSVLGTVLRLDPKTA